MALLSHASFSRSLIESYFSSPFLPAYVKTFGSGRFTGLFPQSASYLLMSSRYFNCFFLNFSGCSEFKILSSAIVTSMSSRLQQSGVNYMPASLSYFSSILTRSSRNFVRSLSSCMNAFHTSCLQQELFRVGNHFSYMYPMTTIKTLVGMPTTIGQYLPQSNGLIIVSVGVGILYVIVREGDLSAMDVPQNEMYKGLLTV